MNCSATSKLRRDYGRDAEGNLVRTRQDDTRTMLVQTIINGTVTRYDLELRWHPGFWDEAMCGIFSSLFEITPRKFHLLGT